MRIVSFLKCFLFTALPFLICLVVTPVLTHLLKAGTVSEWTPVSMNTQRGKFYFRLIKPARVSLGRARDSPNWLIAHH